MTMFYDEREARLMAEARQRRELEQTRHIERLVCCSDGEFRPPIAAEMFEKGQNNGK